MSLPDPPSPTVHAQILATEHWSLLGTRGALISEAAGAGTAVVAGVGVLCGLVYLGAWLEHSRRTFRVRPADG